MKLKPTQLLVLMLSLLAIGAIIKNPGIEVLLHLGLTLGLGLVLFAAFSAISKKPKVLDNTVISTLILFLLIHHTDPIPTAIATFVTIFAKFFLERKGQSIINPVVLGMLVAIILSKFIPSLETPLLSWWGTNFQTDFAIGETIIHFRSALMIMAIWILFGLGTWRKWHILITFLIVHAGISLLIEAPQQALFTFTDATIYFFAAIMLVDPKSSPMKPKQQVAFALVAVAAYNIFSYYHVSHFDLYALAIANLYYFGVRLFGEKSSTVPLNS